MTYDNWKASGAESFGFEPEDGPACECPMCGDDEVPHDFFDDEIGLCIECADNVDIEALEVVV